MLVRLKVIRGKANRGLVDLSIPAVIGRGRDADLTVIHPVISRRHCELYQQDGRLFVRDLGSLNGTYVGAVQVKEGEIHSGDSLSIGPVSFEVQVVDGVPSPLREESPQRNSNPQSDLLVADSETQGISAPSPMPGNDSPLSEKRETEPQPFFSSGSPAAAAAPESAAPMDAPSPHVPSPAEAVSRGGDPGQQPESLGAPPDAGRPIAEPRGLFGDLPPPEAFAPPPPQAESPENSESESGSEAAGHPLENVGPTDSGPSQRGNAWAEVPAPFTPIQRSTPVEPLPGPSGGGAELTDSHPSHGSDSFALNLPTRLLRPGDLPTDTPQGAGEGPREFEPRELLPKKRPAAGGQGGWWPFKRR